MNGEIPASAARGTLIEMPTHRNGKAASAIATSIHGGIDPSACALKCQTGKMYAVSGHILPVAT